MMNCPSAPDGAFARILAATGAIHSVLDPDRLILQLNPRAATVLGHDARSAVGLDFVETCLPISEQARVAKLLDRTAADPGLRKASFATLGADGRTRTMAGCFTPLRDADGLVAGVVISARNLTPAATGSSPIGAFANQIVARRCRCFICPAEGWILGPAHHEGGPAVGQRRRDRR